jgi:hypothetical protein
MDLGRQALSASIFYFNSPLISEIACVVSSVAPGSLVPANPDNDGIGSQADCYS